MPEPIDLEALEAVITAATTLALAYRNITGKPLGITGEVGEYHAAKLLGLQLADARQPGYNAVIQDGHRVQITGHCILLGSPTGQRIGSIIFNHAWDTVMEVLMGAHFVGGGHGRLGMRNSRTRVN